MGGVHCLPSMRPTERAGAARRRAPGQSNFRSVLRTKIALPARPPRLPASLFARRSSRLATWGGWMGRPSFVWRDPAQLGGEPGLPNGDRKKLWADVGGCRTISHMKPMRGLSLLPILPMLAISTGCGHPVQRSLEGRWLGDAVENFQDSQLAAATGWARGLSFEFAGSTATVAVPAEEARTGRYQVSSVHEADVRLNFTSKDGKTSMALFKLDNDHSIRWMLGQGRAVVLRRDR